MGALRKRWTDEELKVLARQRRRGPQALAQELGRSFKSVSTKLSRLHLSTTHIPRVHIPIDDVQIPPVCLHERAIRWRIPPASIAASICGDPKPGYTAYDNSCRKISVQDAIEIGAMYSGRTGDGQIVAIAATYKTSHTTVARILSGEFFDQLLPPHMRDQ